ncbi:hypothetical protein AZI86_11065 [Bdellovibrio bacteriovorus]|uniref:Inositol-phosphate phosphatase n=1 Tax=Bdellovibrio bacteriovorus TaxID=959 RepID=A0A150WL81_BDEBC|nr:inositol monophosphatase [Bdellovibrio bacteriovorus]KYG64740.1 hypothetical protein AZI86_11065 [Bdellovibrio bacteriovorus]
MAHCGTSETAQFIQIAEEACRAGMRSLKSTKNSFEVISQSDKDIKLSADIAAQSAIIQILQQKSSFRIISEEQKNSPITDNETVWIVDPLDGTLNFSRDIPFYGVSIALWKGDTPILGVIGDSFYDEITSGGIGQSVTNNSKKTQVSSQTDIAQSVLATGFPVQSDLSNNALNSLFDSIRAFKKVRMFGSAALSLRLVAQGKIEAYFEKNIFLWDVAAGIALVKAAGGSVKMIPKDNFKYDVLATNGQIAVESILL